MESASNPVRVVAFDDHTRVDTARCRRGSPPCSAMLVYDTALFDAPINPAELEAFYATGWTRSGHENGVWHRDQEWLCPRHRTPAAGATSG